MIVTLTANPSLDRAIELAAPLQHGEVQTARSTREDAAGKGVNVARVVAAAGVGTIAVLPLAASDPYATVLAATTLPTRPVSIRGHARANITVLDPDGTTTKLNLVGAPLSAEEADALVAATVAAAQSANWLALSGSLPPGVPADFYVRISAAVRAAWGDAAPAIAVDTSGAALAAVVAEGQPDLIKPNEHELAELVGRDALDPASLEQIVATAADLVPSRVGAALVTLGAAGAVLVTPEGAWAAQPPAIRPISTVGAGDSSLAGYLLAARAGEAATGCLRTAIRYGAAATTLPGTQPPTPEDLPTVDVPIITLNR